MVGCGAIPPPRGVSLAPNQARIKHPILTFRFDLNQNNSSQSA
jgi:hypothetical protein